MSRTSSSLTHEEQCTFEESMHLYAINNSVILHNKKMLKKLNIPVALCSAEQQRQRTPTTTEDEHLPAKVLLCNEQKVMLTSNLWVHAGLVNGALGKVISIFYSIGSKPPELPSFMVVDFIQYKGTPWDISHPTYVPISPMTRGVRRQIPLQMAWALMTHKSQGMTLDKATVDIGTKERQGLTFTAISRVCSLADIQINPAFPFSPIAQMHKNPYLKRRQQEESLLASKSMQENIL